VVAFGYFEDKAGHLLMRVNGRLAQVLQATLREGRTAPGVTVAYVECPLAAGALPEITP